MKFIKFLFFLLLIAIIGGAIYVASLKSDYTIESKRFIKAPVAVIFDDVNEYKNWENWGPWYEMDSSIVATFPEKTSGVGASYSWKGKDGEGSIETISLKPNKEITHKIDFGTGNQPTVYWNFEKVNGGTEVTWGMKGTNSFTGKLYWLTQGGIEKNMTPMYDRGLELLDQHITTKLEKHTIESKGLTDVGGGFYLYLTSSSKLDKISSVTEDLFPKILSYMKENNIVAAGSPFSLCHKWNEANNYVVFSCCVPIKERIATTNNILVGFQKPQHTFKTILKGSYSYATEAWEDAFKSIAERGLKIPEGSEFFEVYTVGKNQTENPTKWITEIYIPVEQE